MNKIEFINDKYISPDFKPGKVRSFFKNAIFTIKIADIVIRASNIVKYADYNTKEWLNSSCETIRLLESLGVKFEMSGIKIAKNLEGPVIFIGNHMSTLETFIMPLMIQPYREVVYVIKDSLVRMPFFGSVAMSRDPIIVGRSNPKEDYKTVMKQGLERIAAGKSVIVFPQTTRSSSFDPSQFNSIGIKLAKKAGVPVVPVALKTDAWGNGAIIKDLGSIDANQKVHLKLGEPIEVKGNGKNEHQHIIDFISKNLAEWQK